MDKNKSLEYQGHKDLKSTVNLFEQVQKRITNLRDNQVILDVDIAELYNVKTKRINEAVKNNPDKFPEDYMFKLTQEEVTGWLYDIKCFISFNQIGHQKEPTCFDFSL